MTDTGDIDLNSVDVFHFEDELLSFNDLSQENGFTFWYAREYMAMLGYENFTPFKKAINKAIATCMTLDIDVQNNFQQVQTEIDGKSCPDYKMSRFACYLVAMNGDTSKLEVARAQAYFAATAETIRRYVDDTDEVERVQIRGEISEREKGLGAAAKKAGVQGQGFALFHNAGYRGMYNMDLNKLKTYKGLKQKNRSLLDFMGKEELAANLFRVTQTELKMKSENIKGQASAEATAEIVGKRVRKAMVDISGTRPEDLKLTGDIKQVKTSLKQTEKGLKKIDSSV